MENKGKLEQITEIRNRMRNSQNRNNIPAFKFILNYIILITHQLPEQTHVQTAEIIKTLMNFKCLSKIIIILSSNNN